MEPTVDWGSLASRGHAPAAGCSLLGVGYEEAFDTLLRYDVDERFGHGLSSHKMVVGPYGSGKTHFLRQLMELASARGAVTAEVKLNRDIDFTHRLVVYQEIARELKAPNRSGHGMGALLRAMREQVTQRFPEPLREEAFASWVAGITGADLKLDAFARVAKAAFTALERDDDTTLLAAERWLGGEVADRQLSKILSIGLVRPDEQRRWAQRMLLSLFQLVRHAGYIGTVVCLDEAEQGFAVERRRRQRILEMLKADVDDIADLPDGSAMVVYAVTPDIRQDMEEFPPLQQRFADPGGRGFFDGNHLASVIDLTFRRDPTEHLRRMARRLVEVFARQRPLPGGVGLTDAIARVEAMADVVAAEEQSASSRRVLVKRVCAYLLDQPVAEDADVMAEF